MSEKNNFILKTKQFLIYLIINNIRKNEKDIKKYKEKNKIWHKIQNIKNVLPTRNEIKD